MSEAVILVNENDFPIGSGAKMEVHKKGLLHRAFSLFVFNAKGELLLQKRAKEKYHSGGLWSNTCCSHPRVGQDTLQAAHQRLKEEMGFDCELKEIFSFRYKVQFEKGLFEHEYDHVFVGRFDGIPRPDSKEVEAYKWISVDDLKKDLQSNPNNYTYWFKESIYTVLEKYLSQDQD